MSVSRRGLVSPLQFLVQARHARHRLDELARRIGPLALQARRLRRRGEPARPFLQGLELLSGSPAAHLRSRSFRAPRRLFGLALRRAEEEVVLTRLTGDTWLGAALLHPSHTCPYAPRGSVLCVADTGRERHLVLDGKVQDVARGELVLFRHQWAHVRPLHLIVEHVAAEPLPYRQMWSGHRSSSCSLAESRAQPPVGMRVHPVCRSTSTVCRSTSTVCRSKHRVQV
eukprot:6428359-Prymnesium_polylepis.1